MNRTPYVRVAALARRLNDAVDPTVDARVDEVRYVARTLTEDGYTAAAEALEAIARNAEGAVGDVDADAVEDVARTLLVEVDAAESSSRPADHGILSTMPTRHDPQRLVDLMAGHVIANLPIVLDENDLAAATSFADLQDVVDANMFLVDAAEAAEFEFDLNDDADTAILNAVTDVVSVYLAAGRWNG